MLFAVVERAREGRQGREAKDGARRAFGIGRSRGRAARGPDLRAAEVVEGPESGRGLLSGLAEPARGELVRLARRRRFGRRQTLFNQGDPGDGMHFVRSGWVAVRVTVPSGEVAMLGIVGAGQPVGEQALVGVGGRRMASAQALGPVETLFVPRTAFEAVRAEHPGVDHFLAELFEERLRQVSDRLVEALVMPATQRVLRRVAEIAATFPPQGIPLTQEDVAALAGTTRPTVNRVLRQAEAEGVLELARGRIRVLDPVAMERMAG